jgi:hypothetical protein
MGCDEEIKYKNIYKTLKTVEIYTTVFVASQMF